ncbi:MAG: hypothetical protein MZV64_18435 [Ignavibacteriales bacterium]|nr:hypothetical protein [Ignavibacteriales bacterium]
MDGLAGAGLIASDIIEDDVEKENLGQWVALIIPCGRNCFRCTYRTGLASERRTDTQAGLDYNLGCFREAVAWPWRCIAGQLGKSWLHGMPFPTQPSLGAYALTVEMLKKKNAGMESLTDRSKKQLEFFIHACKTTSRMRRFQALRIQGKTDRMQEGCSHFSLLR